MATTLAKLSRIGKKLGARSDEQLLEEIATLARSGTRSRLSTTAICARTRTGRSTGAPRRLGSGSTHSCGSTLPTSLPGYRSRRAGSVARRSLSSPASAGCATKHSRRNSTPRSTLRPRTTGFGDGSGVRMPHGCGLRISRRPVIPRPDAVSLSWPTSGREPVSRDADGLDRLLPTNGARGRASRSPPLHLRIPFTTPGEV